MEEDEKTETETVGTEKNYIEIINKMKANSVDKEEYKKVVAENKQLLDSIVNGSKSDEPAPKTEPVDLDKLRDDLFNKDNTNLEVAIKTLQLRDALIAKGEPDPFLPTGIKIIPDDEDQRAAERVAKVLKETIEEADGDDQMFTNELQRKMVDSGPTRRKR